MNEQTSGQLRQLMQAIGALSLVFGWLNAEQIKAIQDAAGTVAQVAGPLGVAGGIAWSWWVNRPANLIASVDAMAKDPDSPVKAVVVTDTKEGRDLASTMSAGTVVAGTADAKALAMAR